MRLNMAPLSSVPIAQAGYDRTQGIGVMAKYDDHIAELPERR
jgi:hypothetical protein